MVGRTYQVKRRQGKGKLTKQKESRREGRGEGGGGGGEEDRMKKRKEKERKGIKYLDKRKYCVGTEPRALVYIGILVTLLPLVLGLSVTSKR